MVLWCVLLAMETEKKKRGGDNGKRKPVIDDLGNRWCNCTRPTLHHHGLPGGKGQAYCSKCRCDWYH